MPYSNWPRRLQWPAISLNGQDVPFFQDTLKMLEDTWVTKTGNLGSYPDWVEAVKLEFFHRLRRQQWAELREVNGCCYGDCSKDISAATTGRANHKPSLDFTHKETLNYEGTGMGRYMSGFHLTHINQKLFITICFRFAVAVCGLTTEYSQ